MSDRKHSNSKEESTFSYPDSSPEPRDKKYQRRKYIAIGTGGGTIVSLIILATIFRNQLAIFSLIFSFYCTFLWLLPLLFTMIRSYQFEKLVKKEQKKGRLYMVFAFYFLFMWILSLISLLLYLGSVDITVIAYVLFWASTCVFLPYLLFVIIMRL
jgi:hypothetical protein